MNPASEYFVNNFALLLICLGLIFISIQNLKAKRSDSIITLAIVSLVLILSVLFHIEKHSQSVGSQVAATVTCYFGYVIRPAVVLLFARLADHRKPLKFYYFIPVIIVALIYMPSLFFGVEELRTLVFHYSFDDAGALLYHRGTAVFLCFTSHIVSALYLANLIYVSIRKLQGKHIGDAITVLICSFFAIVAVVTESIFSNVYINLLNVTIAVSATFYNIYLFVEYIRADVLTGLFDRKTYFLDLEKMEKNVTGVLMLDMNGLKFINDNQGHIAGDKALTTIANAIQENCKRSCYAYRLGGDEFAVLIIKESKEFVVSFANKVKEEMDKTEYHCSIGYAYREKATDVPYDDLIIEAEKMMYDDKARYYKESGIERRRSRG